MFRPRPAPSRQEVDRQRGSARARGYTAQWDRASAGYLRAHPLCVGCEATGRTEAAAVTDHTVPHRGDRVLFWDRGNWQGACAWHHDVVKQLLELEWKAGRVPASALHLDSDAARALTLNLRGVGG